MTATTPVVKPSIIHYISLLACAFLAPLVMSFLLPILTNSPLRLTGAGVLGSLGFCLGGLMFLDAIQASFFDERKFQFKFLVILGVTLGAVFVLMVSSSDRDITSILAGYAFVLCSGLVIQIFSCVHQVGEKSVVILGERIFYPGETFRIIPILDWGKAEVVRDGDVLGKVALVCTFADGTFRLTGEVVLDLTDEDLEDHTFGRDQGGLFKQCLGMIKQQVADCIREGARAVTLAQALNSLWMCQYCPIETQKFRLKKLCLTISPAGE
jgi:hypothetical protein